MENISLETLENFCRTCLKQFKRQKFNIQSLDLQIRQWLQDVTLDNPLAMDTYPNSVCRSCRNKLKDLVDFRQMCARSRKKISDIINKKYGGENRKNITGNTSTPKKKGMHEGTQVEHFLQIDMADNRDVECSVKSEPVKEELGMKEALINDISPNYIKNETEVAKLDSFNYFKKDNADEKENNSDFLDEEPFQRGGENSDSECYVPNNYQYCSSLDESINKVDRKNKNLSEANKSAANSKKYLYTFPCDECKHRALSQQNLDIHKRIHLGLKRYQCSKCDEAFDNTKQLLKHLKKNHKEKELNIVCELEDCGMKFKSTGSYKKHYRQNHIECKEEPSEETDKPAVKTPYQHVCEECGKRYSSSQAFKEHQYTHGPKELYPFQCKECGKAFAMRRSFKVHQQRHAGIKNFECSFCGAKKTTKKELTIHVNTHTREKKFPCPNCPKIFYRTTNLRVHVEVVHQGIRRFACRYCEQTFGKGDNLRMHELLHTGEKPHECKECGRRFVQRVQLRSHMRTHNK